MKILKYLTSRKYRLFVRKMRAAQESIWDIEFKLYKARQLREESRLGRDRANDALYKVAASLKAPGADVKKLEEEKTKLEAEVKGYEAQIDLVDIQIKGIHGSDQYEDQNGIIETLEGLASLREQYKDFASKI